MALGNSPFGFSPAGQAYPAAASEDRGTLSSSRGIDVRGRYLTESDGSFTPMDDVAQTVLLNIAYEVVEPPVISPAALEQIEAQIKSALAPLAAGTEPVLRILEIQVTDDGRMTTRKLVRFLNLRTNTMQTVTL